MSKEGKMRRGEKWYGYRDLNGNLPADIKEDSNKMKDIDYFLENKPKETKSKGRK